MSGARSQRAAPALLPALFVPSAQPSATVFGPMNEDLAPRLRGEYQARAGQSANLVLLQRASALRKGAMMPALLGAETRRHGETRFANTLRFSSFASPLLRLKSCLSLFSVSSSASPRLRVKGSRGQSAVEFALLFAGVILPLTFITIFTAEMLWIWHSVEDFTRDGARYAATHCWMSDNSNVLGYMQSHAPAMVDQQQFQAGGAASIQVQYFAQDPVAGTLSSYGGCASECSAACLPDAVSVSIANYQFARLSGFFKLPPVTIPPFTAQIPMESAGCDVTGTCLP